MLVHWLHNNKSHSLFHSFHSNSVPSSSFWGLFSRVARFRANFGVASRVAFLSLPLLMDSFGVFMGEKREGRGVHPHKDVRALRTAKDNANRERIA